MKIAIAIWRADATHGVFLNLAPILVICPDANGTLCDPVTGFAYAWMAKYCVFSVLAVFDLFLAKIIFCLHVCNINTDVLLN